MILKYCFKGLAFQEMVPAPTLFTGVDAEVQGAVASNIIWAISSVWESASLARMRSSVRPRYGPPEQRKGNVRFGRCMVHIVCLKHTNEGMVRFQWCSGARFSGVLTDEVAAFLRIKRRSGEGRACIIDYSPLYMGQSPSGNGNAL